MNIEKMSLEEYKEELSYKLNKDKLYPPIVDKIYEYPGEIDLPVSCSILASEFGTTTQRMTLYLKYLIMEGLVACDPSIKRCRKYWAIDYRKAEKQQIKEQQGPKNTTLALEPTILSGNDKQALEQQINRLQCYLTVSDLNKDHTNKLLISLDDRNLIVQYTPGNFKKIKTFLHYIQLFPTGNDHE